MVFRISATDAGLKSVMASARSEIAQTAQSQKAVSQGELSMRQQLAAAASLQRQRSAALISDWKRQEAAAKSLASATRPVGENLQTITNIMRQMGASVGVLQGPLNGISGRITSLGTLAKTAGGEMEGMGESAATAGGSVAAMAGPIGIAAVATAALVAGSALLAKGLFDLAVAAADFRGKMFDLSQQTGVAVETLSALEVVASTTGGSIESVAQSLVIYQGHLDDAQDSTSKMGIKFKELKISTDNTEESFRDALKVLSQMPEGFEQTNTAAELFGRRGGKQVLAIIKEMDGDLPGLTSKLQALGLMISTEDAKAADQFNDQMQILTLQFRAMLGKEVIPAALIALERLSGLFQENARSISFMGQVLGSFSNTVLAGFLLKLQEVEFVLVSIEALAGALDRAMGHASLPGLTGGVGSDSSFKGAQAGAEGIAPLKRTGGGSRTSARSSAVDDGSRELQRQTEFTARLLRQVQELSDAYSGIDTTTRAYAVSQSIANGELAKASPGMQKMALDAAKTADEFDKLVRLNKELADFQKDLAQATWELTRSDKGLLEQALDLIASMEAEGKALSKDEEQTLLASAATVQLAKDKERLIEALNNIASMPPAPVLGGLNEDEAAQLAGAAANAQLGPPPVAPAVIDSWKTLHEVANEAINDMAQGIGGLVQQWVLYGTAGPNAMRKMVASVLAGVAAQAAVKAIFELASGFAALADPFLAWTAPMHFQSAALFGSIAAVSAVAGRVVAGNAFQQTTSTGGSRGGSNSGGASGSSTPATREANRTQPPTIVIHMSGEAAAAFDYKVVKAVVGNHRLNGEIRKMTETGES